MKETYCMERLINYARALELIIGEKVDLIQKIPDVNAAQRVHLRER
jgi:hypothetical protein